MTPQFLLTYSMEPALFHDRPLRFVVGRYINAQRPLRFIIISRDTLHTSHIMAWKRQREARQALGEIDTEASKYYIRNVHNHHPHRTTDRGGGSGKLYKEAFIIAIRWPAWFLLLLLLLLLPCLFHLLLLHLQPQPLDISASPKQFTSLTQERNVSSLLLEILANARALLY